MLKIRLMRIGDKKKPFYRVVVVDERNKRTGGYIENVGTYNPLTQPKEIKLNKERIEHWIKMGAQKSDGFLRILGEAPKRPERKPKKERKNTEAAASNPQPKTETPEEVKTENEPTKEEAPVETPVAAISETQSNAETIAVAEEEKV